MSLGERNLPEDILYLILQFVAQNEIPCRLEHSLPVQRAAENGDTITRDTSYYSRVLGWIRFGHVCKTWQRVTLASRSLWAASIGTLPAGLHEMMHRAGPHQPITVHMYMGERRNPMVDTLCGWLLVPGMNDVDIIPRLRAIQIVYLGCVRGTDGLWNYPFNVIKGLSSYNLPNLCRLELSSACTSSILFHLVALEGRSISMNIPSSTTLSVRGYFVN